MSVGEVFFYYNITLFIVLLHWDGLGGIGVERKRKAAMFVALLLRALQWYWSEVNIK